LNQGGGGDFIGDSREGGRRKIYRGGGKKG